MKYKVIEDATETPASVLVLSVLAILALLLLLALRASDIPVVKAHLTRLLQTVGPIKMEIALYQAQSGKWPESRDLPFVEEYEAKQMPVRVKVNNGSFSTAMKLPYDDTGFQAMAFNRLELADTGPSFTVVWSCATRPTSANARYSNEFTATLNSRYLPSICRN